MQLLRHLYAKLPALFQGMAASVLASLLLALAMAGSPELHKHLHDCAECDEHECVVTHLIAGDFEGAAPTVVLEICAPLALLGLVHLPTSTWVRPLFFTSGVLEHAPPTVA